jgi:beta-lactamase regulating signal transducer with metallopeptidase domain
VDIVLNWLWQGVAIAVAAAVILRVLPRSRTQARYGTLWVGSVAVVALPAVPAMTAAFSPIPSTPELSLPGPALSIPVSWWTSAWLAVGLWLAWCGVGAARLLIAAARLLEAKRTACGCPPDVEARLRYWARVKLTGRPTRLALSTRVRSAAVLGCGAPVIALAPALIRHLGDDDLDRVVIHEWAHVQRRDDVAQLVQRLVWIVAGWHPAVWWLDRQMDLEREVACDEVAVGLTGSAKRYAACLTTLAALPLAAAASWPAPAVVSSSGLRRRIVRILAAHGSVTPRPWRTVTVSASTALIVFALTVGQVRVVIEAASSSGFSRAVESLVRKPMASNAAPNSSPRPARSSSPRSRRSQAPTGRVTHTNDRIVRTDRAETPTVVEPPVTAPAPLPMPVGPELNGSIVSALGTLAPPQIPEHTLTEAHTAMAPVSPAPADLKTRTPWGAAADVGVAIGRGSENAGLATAGFFSRIAKRVAGSVR